MDQRLPGPPDDQAPCRVPHGSGKGTPEWWIANIKPGRVLFELSGVPEDVAREAMRLAIHKLPMKLVSSPVKVVTTDAEAFCC
ncbi:LSU ribosomal protein L16p [Cutibacterium acnes JCM 18916]|nr:LSU ribosomal protein L16p [Cutibacterium acnes JCM 18916]